MTTQIVDKLTFENCANNYNDLHVVNDMALAHVFAQSIRIVDLTNAGQRGKRCRTISVWGNGDRCLILNWLSDYQYNLRRILTLSTIELEMGCKHYGLCFDVGEQMAHKVITPLKRPAPLKELPKKWTVDHARRALANGQATDCKLEMDFDGMTDSHTFHDDPISAEQILEALSALSLGCAASSDGRVVVGNSACSYSFRPALA